MDRDRPRPITMMIPADGAQHKSFWSGLGGAQKAQCTPGSAECRYGVAYWIPACAGMTGDVE